MGLKLFFYPIEFVLPKGAKVKSVGAG